jgi:hypothetical protein
MSSFDLWRDILETNSVEVSAALDAYIEELTALRRDFEGEFRKAGEFARSLRARDAEHGDTISRWPAKYLNRLSDLLFILARAANVGAGDVLWRPGGDR